MDSGITTAETTLTENQSITRFFYEQLPYYLSIGMSAEEYWNGDYRLAKAYRKADELRLQRANQLRWLQGMYIYEAVGNLSPILGFNLSTDRRDHTPKKYRDTPIPITREEIKAQAEKQRKAEEERLKAAFEAFVAGLKEKRGGDNG